MHRVSDGMLYCAKVFSHRNVQRCVRKCSDCQRDTNDASTEDEVACHEMCAHAQAICDPTNFSAVTDCLTECESGTTPAVKDCVAMNDDCPTILTCLVDTNIAFENMEDEDLDDAGSDVDIVVDENDVPGDWTCPDSFWNDGWCDCGCEGNGSPDIDCTNYYDSCGHAFCSYEYAEWVCPDDATQCCW